MGMQSGVDPGHIAKMMGQPEQTSHLSSMMKQPDIDPSQMAKMMGKVEASNDQMTSNRAQSGADPNQMVQMMGKVPFGPGSMQLCTNFDGVDLCKLKDLEDQNTLAYALFIVASFLYGIGGPATMVLGIPYIDEHASRGKTDFCLGEFYELRSLLDANWCLRMTTPFINNMEQLIFINNMEQFILLITNVIVPRCLLTTVYTVTKVPGYSFNFLAWYMRPSASFSGNYHGVSFNIGQVLSCLK